MHQEVTYFGFEKKKNSLALALYAENIFSPRLKYLVQPAHVPFIPVNTRPTESSIYSNKIILVHYSRHYEHFFEFTKRIYSQLVHTHEM